MAPGRRSRKTPLGPQYDVDVNSTLKPPFCEKSNSRGVIQIFQRSDERHADNVQGGGGACEKSCIFCP